MVRKIVALFALVSVVFAQAAMAANQKPPDVPTPVVQNVTYAAGTTLNVHGYGSTTTPDTPPYFASMPADIPTLNRTTWLATDTDYNHTSSFCTMGEFAGCAEAKFRSHLNVNHILYDDPIRNYAEPGTSHCHQFFGNMATNAFSTYATLRTRNEARAAGGRLNGTGYWAPCIVLTNPFSDGKNYALKMTQTLLYYFADPAVSPSLVRLPRGLRYVGGRNMDDPENTQVLKEIATANAQPGTTGRYTTLGGGEGIGFGGWNCATAASGGGQNAALGLKPSLNNGGVDPWAGACASNGNGPATIWADFDGPDCWDGINPWVPGGYANMRYSITDNVLDPTGVKRACPNHWYHIPAIRLELSFTTTGWTDYQRWRLSSDDGMKTRLDILPACSAGYANAPCTTTSSPHTVKNGVSFHTDWFGAWDDLTLRTWHARCLGVRNLLDGSGVAIDSTPHQCQGSIIDNAKSLKTLVPPDGSHNPIISLTNSYPSSSASNMFRIRTVNPSGMMDYHVH